MAAYDMEQRIARIRRFNRAYTKSIGALNEGLLDSPFSLAETRVLYELANRDGPTAAALAGELGLDPGYLSRLLGSLERRGLIRRISSREDRRRSHLRLTAKGRKAFEPLDGRSHDDTARLLSRLPEKEQQRLIGAIDTVEGALVPSARPGPPYTLRLHRPGDMGWVVHRHGALYAREYGWNEEFEALVAEIVAHFIRHLDPARERCWIAERNGEILGSVFLVRKSERVAKLRLLLVEPNARGLGLGTRLANECSEFARGAGYRKITLWTNSVLDAARHIYERAGYTLVEEEPHESFGKKLVGQYWALTL
jgi:DNA-binding MarR family transcriptional regulator/GNAT superfamily N-acetyltransferase